MLQPIMVDPAPSGDEEGIFCIAFAPDGETLATGSDDRTVRLWNIRSLREMARLEHPSSVVTTPFLQTETRWWQLPSAGSFNSGERQAQNEPGGTQQAFEGFLL
jgi:WD40 repeat protein